MGVVANVNEVSLIFGEMTQNLNGRVEIKFVGYYKYILSLMNFAYDTNQCAILHSIRSSTI